MKFFAVEEFAAKRRAEQDRYAAQLLPFAESGIKALVAGEKDWDHDLLEEAIDIYTEMVEAQTDEATTTDPFRKAFRDSLSKTTADSDPKVIALWMAQAAINAATIKAAELDTEDVLLEWQTMLDSDVRHTHEEVEGQRRTPGDAFDVDGVEMRYPGDPTAPIALWINCRCVLRPVPVTTASAVLSHNGISTTGNYPTTDGRVYFTTTTTNTANAITFAGQEKGDTMTDEEINEEITIESTPWFGVLAPEGVPSGDRRMFATDSLRHRPLPLPLTWQKTSTEGHGQAVTVARIDEMERIDGLIWASGVFLNSPEADEVIGMIAEFGKFGVSVDADDVSFEFDEASEMLTFSDARIAGSCIVPIPAFAEAFVAIGHRTNMGTGTPLAEVSEGAPEEALVAASFKRGPGWITNPAGTKRLHDYWTKKGEPGYNEINWGVPGDFNRCRVLVGKEIAENSPEDVRFLNQICAQWHHDALGIWPGQEASAKEVLTDTDPAPALTLVAGGHCAPSEWFVDPELDRLSGLTITDDGQVFGHIAGWQTCHTGFKDMCVAPPASHSKYAYFLTGEVVTDKGNIPVGNLTIGGGHAPSHMRARPAAAHYDNTSAAVADVTIGEDAFGIWVAGWVRPGATDEQITALRASAISGDWRDIGGHLELVAALAVNSPGFPIPRVAASNETQLSLVAAGVVNDDSAAKAAEAKKISELAEAVAASIEERAARREKMKVLMDRVRADH